MSKSNSISAISAFSIDPKEILEEKRPLIFDPLCIRKKGNWSSVKNEHKIDDPRFNPELFLKDIPSHSPKLDALLRKIDYLDKKDEREYGTKFKHFIFSDIKSGGHGAKMLAAGLISTGWQLGYSATLKSKNSWGPIEMKSDAQLSESASNNFYLLSSVSVFDKPISVKMKKEILARFNARPENIHGDLSRIIVMDSGFKEGIDLFDIKYVHIFEPSLNMADQKQVIGRGTRTCGQKGLEFHPVRGWPLEVYLYDLEIPAALQPSLLDSSNTRELLMKAMNADVRMANFGYDLERLSIIGSVDYELNKNVHKFSVDLDGEAIAGGAIAGGAHRKFGEKHGDILIRTSNRMSHKEMVNYIRANFGQYKWEDVVMQNLCASVATDKSASVSTDKSNSDIKRPRNSSDSIESSNSDIKRPRDIILGGAPTILNYTPTQNFIRHYFSPTSPVKGMLLHHSVGTGKTASAIAAATTNFEPAGYTILWATRTTLKNDIWKNMFDQVASETIRNLIASGAEIPEDQQSRLKLLSKAWRIRPISYKQFSNLVSKQNAYYERLVKENGEADPLRKTLLIIDEAHKLYGGGDLSSLERPDMTALHKALMNSYAVSGKDSVRVLLMTATPITVNPIEMIQLMNLCKPIDEQIPTDFETFSRDYLREDGTFSEMGETRYLDDIAGHISYLNREKDARQFAQPVLKNIFVPIADLAEVRDFDKYIAKTESEEQVLQLQEEIQAGLAKVDSELSEIDKTRFEGLLKICDNYPDIPKKKCEKICNANIRGIMKEVKQHVNSLRQNTKMVRNELKHRKTEKMRKLADIKKNIDRNPTKFEDYKKSAYMAIKSACSSKASAGKKFLEFVKKRPEIIELDRQIESDKSEIREIESRVAIESGAYKGKIKQMREQLRNPELAALERAVLESTIKSSQSIFKKSAKNLTSRATAEITDIKKNIRRTETEKKRAFNAIRKTMSADIKYRKKSEKETRKELKTLRKTMRKQGILSDDIKDVIIKDMVDRHKEKIVNDLEELEENEKMKDFVRMRKAQVKAEARETLREEKRLQKEIEKQRNKAEKELEKTRKQKEKATKESKRKTIKEKKPSYLAT